jgi:predicted amidohydrolase YtcJ
MAPNGTADLAFVNGRVATMDSVRRWAGAVAVSKGEIVAVGSDGDAGGLIGSGTEVVDLAGRLLVPGFQDAHVHPPSSGFEMLHCNLSEAYDVGEYERIISGYASANPKDPWVVGGGWSMDVFPGGNPPKDILDRVVPDRPVFLMSRDGHSGWANSRALEIAGVTRDTPDPPDGWIVRDAAGDPAGAVHEGAFVLVERHVPETKPSDWVEGLLSAQRHLHALGITAWQDAIVGGSYPTLDAYRQVAASGELTARVVGALWWDRYRGIEQVEDLLAARERGRVGRFAATTVKIMQDGVIENFTAAVLEPYLDAEGRPTDNRGTSFVEAQELKVAVTRLDAEGFQVHIHARPWTRSRPLGRRTGRTTIATTSRTSRSSTRTTSRASASSAWSRTPNRSGRSTRGRCSTSRSRSWGPNARPGNTRSRASSGRGRCSRWGATGRSRARTRFGRCTSPSTAPPRTPTSTAAEPASRSCLMNASTCRPRSPGSRSIART